MKKMLMFASLSTVISALFAHAADFRYQPDWDSIRSHYQCPEWFRDAKFGIFLHWGPYAVTGIDTKYPKGIYQQGWKNGLSWNYHRDHFAIPRCLDTRISFPCLRRISLMPRNG